MTTIWYRGKARTFYDDDEAAEWVKEIDMAKQEKRTPKPKKAKEVVPAAAVVETAEEIEFTPPELCADCGVTLEENNLGGYSVTHPTRMGSAISASVQSEDEAEVWLATTHGQES